ncbi:hypothetical protein RI054_14g71110 [Pseudoscourfieldia marina]
MSSAPLDLSSLNAQAQLNEFGEPYLDIEESVSETELARLVKQGCTAKREPANNTTASASASASVGAAANNDNDNDNDNDDSPLWARFDELAVQEKQALAKLDDSHDDPFAAAAKQQAQEVKKAFQGFTRGFFDKPSRSTPGAKETPASQQKPPNNKPAPFTGKVTEREEDSSDDED